MNDNKFENENVAVAMTRETGSKVILDIKISAKAAEAAYHQAIKAINKQVSLPGFRKGKAPETMIIKQFTPHIDREWKDIVTNIAFKEAISLAQVYPYREGAIGRPQLKTLTREAGGELIIDFEALPEIPSIDPASLTLKPIEKEPITDEQIKDAIEDIRYQHAEWTDVTDRAVKKDDYIEIDIENMSTGEPTPLFQHTRFKVDKDNMGKWMQKLVIGKNIGDQVEGVTENESKKGEKENKDFKPTPVRITIHKIQTATLPEFNDEFAKKLGLEDIAAINEKVKAELDRFAEEGRQNKMRDQLSEVLIKNYHIDLPASMIQADIKHSSDAAIARVRAHAKEGEDIAEEAKQAAFAAAKEIENSYQLYFMLRKVAEEHKITATSQEVMHELMRQMFSANPSERIIDPKGDPQESRSKVFAYLVEQKAKDWLIEQALK